MENEQGTQQRPEEHRRDGDHTSARFGTFSSAESTVSPDSRDRHGENGRRQVGYRWFPHAGVLATCRQAEGDDQRVSKGTVGRIELTMASATAITKKADCTVIATER